MDVQDLTLSVSENATRILSMAPEEVAPEPEPDDEFDLGKRLMEDLGIGDAISKAAKKVSSELEEGTFQMLWDCQYCGSEKLLGVTHRFCPHCGAAQNPDTRYFPTAGEEVALHDHVYVGVDVLCPACEAPNSAAADFCGNCSASLEDGEKARVRPGQIAAMLEQFQEDKRDLVKEKFDAEQARLAKIRAEEARNATFFGRNRKKIRIGSIGGAILAVLLSVLDFFLSY